MLIDHLTHGLLITAEYRLIQLGEFSYRYELIGAQRARQQRGN